MARFTSASSLIQTIFLVLCVLLCRFTGSVKADDEGGAGNSISPNMFVLWIGIGFCGLLAYNRIACH